MVPSAFASTDVQHASEASTWGIRNSIRKYSLFDSGSKGHEEIMKESVVVQPVLKFP